MFFRIVLEVDLKLALADIEAPKPGPPPDALIDTYTLNDFYKSEAVSTESVFVELVQTPTYYIFISEGYNMSL